MPRSVTNCVRTRKPLDFAAQTWYSKGMKNEIAVPIYSSPEALLAAELALAAEAAKKAAA